MASNKVGTTILIKLATKYIVGELSNGLSFSSAAVDVSSKEDGNESRCEYGRVSETATVSGVASSTPDSTRTGIKELYEAMYAGTKLAFVRTQYDSAGAEVAGAKKLTGTCVVTSVDDSNDDGSQKGFSFTLEFDGKSTITTVGS